ncbi:transport system permease protein [Caenispirillum salinarum AK4]|uniref:Transport system permease protein n=1 Tax=Caenispirillum salinarum AK4 TaxID=1238182 RepID=K9H2R7_9PROT|nr:iron ABC transporter permease [Caenispirillum salinarum]EKV31882.1 transport system permease protein [Caenispirillum salinarum AK4]
MIGSHRPARLGLLQVMYRPRALALVGVLAGLVAALALASVALGSTWIPLSRILAALVGAGAEMDTLIVVDFRLPRALMAVLAGACLGVAGLLLQRATRNPLASPTVLGIVDGGGVAVLLFLILFSDADDSLMVSIHWQPAAAALGAVVFLGLVFWLSREQRTAPVRLILYGVAVAALAKAAITLLMVTGPVYRASQATRWLAGALDGVDWMEVRIAGVLTVLLLGVAALVTRRMNVLDLDEISAHGLGVGNPLNRLGLFVLAALLTATAVSFLGGIGFVGLMAPHLATALLGRPTGAGLVGTALIGAALVLSADLIVRALFAPIEVPAGAVTALVGGPYLLYLLTRKGSTHG